MSADIAPDIVNGLLSEDRRAMLAALLKRLASAVDEPDIHPRDLTAIIRQMRQITTELAADDAGEDGEHVASVGDSSSGGYETRDWRVCAAPPKNPSRSPR